MSNYYSLTKALLIEKDLAFEEIKAPPCSLRITLPVPLWERCPPLKSMVSFCPESIAIFNYDEAAHWPVTSDPFAAAKAMELACHLKLDVELVARRCLPEALFNQPVSDETKSEVKRDLAKGIKAVERLMICDHMPAVAS